MKTEKDLTFGKLPPQAVDLEEAILGCLLLLGNEAYLEVSEILNTPEVFYKEQNKIVYQALQVMKDNSMQVDILTICNHLKNNGKLDAVGGAYYIATLTNRVSSDAHLKTWAIIIFEKYMKRELIKVATDVATSQYSDETTPADAFVALENTILRLSKTNINNIKTIRDGCKQATIQILKNKENKGVLTGIPTGFMEYDKRTGGLQGTDLIVIAGETSNGKTTFALNIANNASINNNYKGAIYSLEMSLLQLTSRLIAMNSGVSGNAITSHILTDEQEYYVNRTINHMIHKNLFFDENSTSDINSIIRSIRTLKVKENIDYVVVDYIGLVSCNDKGMSKEQQVSIIATKLKNIAKELNIPIIAVSQLRRDENPRPVLRRLRDSGTIEQAADLVIFTYNPSCRGLETFIGYPEYDQMACRDLCLIDVAKGRNSGIFNFVVNFNGGLTKMYDLAPDYEPTQITSSFTEF